MTRLAVVAVVALLAWALSKRASTNPSSTRADAMDGVQWDPWTRGMGQRLEPVTTFATYTHPDPSHLEATALAAIRRTATQSGPVGPSA